MTNIESFELPSLEEIEWKGSDHNRCQKCAISIPLRENMHRPSNDRLGKLQTRKKWMEHYCHKVDVNELKALEAEIAALLKEDAEADFSRSLPLHSCKITGFRFVCGTCYDEIYKANSRRRKRLVLQQQYP